MLPQFIPLTKISNEMTVYVNILMITSIEEGTDGFRHIYMTDGTSITVAETIQHIYKLMSQIVVD